MPAPWSREVRLPAWCHWAIAVGVLQQTVAVVGETIDPERGVLTWARRSRGGEVDVMTVSPGRSPDTVVLTAEAGEPERVEVLVRRRLHLDLVNDDVEGVLRRADYPGLPGDAPAFRIPTATSPWAFCLTYLSGGSALHTVTRRLFELGEARGELLLPPTPETFAELTQSQAEATGLIPRRARALRETAAAFAESPELDEPGHLQSLPAEEAVDLVLSLPRLGRTRAPLLAALAWGHHDVAYDPYSPANAKSLGTQHRSALGDAFERAAPLRSVLADSILLELLSSR